MVSAADGGRGSWTSELKKGDLPLRLNEYMMSKENLERNVLEQDVILQAMTTSVKPPEENLRSLENE